MSKYWVANLGDSKILQHISALKYGSLLKEMYCLQDRGKIKEFKESKVGIELKILGIVYVLQHTCMMRENKWEPGFIITKIYDRHEGT